MRVGLGQDDLLDIPQPDISPYVEPPRLGGVLSFIDPYRVTILPPEQRLFGVNANMMLTLGIGVLVVGVILTMVRR